MLKIRFLWIGLLLVYFAFLTRTYYWDGVLFSLYIEKAYRAEMPVSMLFHPNHLLYSGFGYLLYSISQVFGLQLRAIALLQSANAVSSAITAALLLHLSLRLYKSTRLAVFCSSLFAFGATWWKFSTDADSYILSVLLLLLAAFFVIGDKQSLLLAGILHVLAMLFHQLAIFAYFPVLAAIWSESQDRSTRIRRACGYVLGTAACVSAAYRLAYQFAGRGSGRTFLQWVTSFSAESQMTHTWQQIVIGYPVSYLKLLGGGKLSLVKDYLSFPVIGALLFACVFVLTGIWLLRHPVRQNSVPINKRRKIFLWAWIVPYVLFLCWWEPGNAFYKLFIWPPIVLLLGCAIAERHTWLARTNAFVAFSAALAAWNFGAFIFPHAHSSADPVLTLAETINRELPADATVYYKVLSPDDWYLQYFAPGRRWLPLSASSMVQLTPAPVCAETTALDDLGQSFTGKINPRLQWRLVNSKHNVRLACLQPEGKN